MELDGEDDAVMGLEVVVDNEGDEGDDSGRDAGAYDGPASAAGSSEATKESKISTAVTQGARRRSKTAVDSDGALDADWDSNAGSADVPAAPRSETMSKRTEVSM